MKEYAQSQQSQSQQSESSNNSSSAGSTASQSTQLQQAGGLTLSTAFDQMVNGFISQAKNTAHQVAEMARQHQDNQTAQWAGKVWTIANTFSGIQQSIAQEKMDGVKEKSAFAGEQIRAVMGTGQVSQESAEKLLKSAGGYWTLADKEAKENTSANASGAAEKALNSETVEQHHMPTNRPGAHCGIATALMLLQANGKGDMGDANQLVSEMYILGDGTDVDLMGQALRKRGLKNAESTRSGTWTQLMDTLKKGQPVPFGVNYSVGTVVKMNSRPSKYYSHLRPGDRYEDSFPGAGHWILVVGFEGSVENPTHFLYNDPNLGGQVRASKAELEKMGVGNGQFWQVTQ